jgi:hypothetical protein
MLLGTAAFGAASTALRGDFIRLGETGVLRLGLDGAELERRVGWVPEEILDLRGGLGTLSLVIWRSFPRRLYARPELWRQLGNATRRIWPTQGAELDWYQAEVELRAFKNQDRLVVRRAVVVDNFAAPLLRVVESFGFRGGSFRSLGKAYAPAETPSQQMNLLADLLRGGDVEGARKVAAAIPEEAKEERQRAILLLGVPPEGKAREVTRKTLLDIANQRGVRSLQAADLLLQMKTKEANLGQ